MTNSDPFSDIHRLRDSRVRQAFETAHRHLSAAAPDLDDMLRARRVDQLAPGTGLAGGGRGGDRADPTANHALRHDRTVALWQEWDLAVAELTHAAATLTRLRQAVLHDPTPTGLCRDGACPEGRMADRGKTMRGVARCHACYRFWTLDASNVVTVEVVAEGWVRVEVIDFPLVITADGALTTHWVDWPVATPPPFARPGNRP